MVRALCLVASYFDSRFFMACSTSWAMDYSPYNALLLVNTIFKTGALKRHHFRDRSPFYDGTPLPSYPSLGRTGGKCKRKHHNFYPAARS